MRDQPYRNYSQDAVIIINMQVLGNLYEDIDTTSLGIPPKEKKYCLSSLVSTIDPAVSESWSEIKTEEIGINEVLTNIEKLSQRVINIIGENGAKRFEVFKQYREGWDNGYGLPLSMRSTAVMESFLYKFSNFKTEPSLFLTRNGNLQLGWENKYGQIAELEFYPDKIEYYMEALDIEGQIGLDEQEIKKTVSMLQHND